MCSSDLAAVNGDHGRMTLEDFQTYRALERAVVRGTYRGREIVSMPPPSSGGVHVIQILNLLEGFELGHLGHNSADALHLIAEASKLAFADRAAHLGDPDFFRVPVAGLVAKRYADTLRPMISRERARSASEIAPGRPQPFESDQTTDRKSTRLNSSHT